MARRMKDLAGKRFNSLTGIKPAGKDKQGRYLWIFKCDCGKYTKKRGFCAVQGRVKTCGCGLGKIRRLSYLSEYKSWTAMRIRCYDKKSTSYERYGGRGIKVCDRWRDSFENFLADMGKRPSPQHSIDRIDNDGNYTPENCRWATRKQQSENKRNSIILTLENETHSITDWAKKLNMSSTGLKRRLTASGYDIEKSLTASKGKFINNPHRLITINNQTMILSDWAKHFGIDYKALYSKVYRRKWSVEKAIEHLSAKIIK